MSNLIEEPIVFNAFKHYESVSQSAVLLFQATPTKPWYLSRVLFKIFDEQPRHFYMEVPPQALPSFQVTDNLELLSIYL